MIAAHRAHGGLSKDYFEALGNTMGGNTYVDGTWSGGDYTVMIEQGTANVPFVVHDYSPLTDPKGPATLLPGRVYNDTTSAGPYEITVTITGSAGPEKELENKFNKLKPAHTVFYYTYVP